MTLNGGQITVDADEQTVDVGLDCVNPRLHSEPWTSLGYKSSNEAKMTFILCSEPQGSLR